MNWIKLDPQDEGTWPPRNSVFDQIVGWSKSGRPEIGYISREDCRRGYFTHWARVTPPGGAEQWLKR